MQHVALPTLYLITPEPILDTAFFYHLEACLERGISLIQLRAKNLSTRDYCYCAEKALRLCERHRAQLFVNTTPNLALSVGAHGVHLNGEQLLACQEHPKKLWLAASCHSLKDIQQANLIRTDFIVLSPVCLTASHPEALPLGWLEFSKLTAHANCPVFALGGMKAEDVPKAKGYGAQGIAAIRALWLP